MAVRVLIVDDFEPFRQLLRSALQDSAGVEVISEVSDGSQAVRQAETLQPDLILLDIGLPDLNGIEVARRIRDLCPGSKVLFISQESAADVVRIALATGAMGYVVKADIEAELLAAVDALHRGERFVGKRFAKHDLTDERPICGVVERDSN